MRHGSTALLSILTTALPALGIAQVAATPESLRVRGVVSSFEAKVQAISQQMATQRQLEEEMGRIYFELLQKRSDAPSPAVRSVLAKMYAASAQQMLLRRRLESLCSSERKPDGYMGVIAQGGAEGSQVGNEPPVLKLRTHQVVESVEPGSPAEKAGIHTRDVIISINGKDLRAGDVVAADLLRPGTRLPVKLQRGGEVVTVSVLVEPRPESFNTQPCPFVDASIASTFTPAPAEFTYRMAFPDSGDPQRRIVVGKPAGYGARTTIASTAPAPLLGPFVAGFSGGTSALAGIQMIPMNRDLAQIFGVAEGLMIWNLLPGTPAERSGLRVGDVLLTANEQDLTSARVLQREMTRSDNHEVTLLVVRKQKRQTITLRW